MLLLRWPRVERAVLIQLHDSPLRQRRRGVLLIMCLALRGADGNACQLAWSAYPTEDCQSCGARRSLGRTRFCRRSHFFRIHSLARCKWSRRSRTPSWMATLTGPWRSKETLLERSSTWPAAWTFPRRHKRIFPRPRVRAAQNMLLLPVLHESRGRSRLSYLL